MVKIARAFAPAHITGFFEICDSSPDPLRKGSRGAGISLSLGVFTKVRLAKGGGLEIRINGKRSRAPVSRSVLRHFALKGFDWQGRLEVDHQVQVPMGSGFGTSGAGALSLALAMNSLLGNKLTKTEAARIAHLAEIECKTGLGTVIGEFVGGYEVRTKAGAPGMGRTVKFFMDRDLEAICLWFGLVSKPAALSNRAFRKAVNVAGRGRVQKLLKNPARFSEPAVHGYNWVHEFAKNSTPDSKSELSREFMELSRKFAESLPGLITPRMRRTLDECDRAKLPCSVMMIGHSLFALARNKDEKRILLRIFKKHSSLAGKVIRAKVDNESVYTRRNLRGKNFKRTMPAALKATRAAAIALL